MKIVAAGMSGLIGKHLAIALAKKHDLVRLVRKRSVISKRMPGREILWNPGQIGDWATEIDGSDVVINLCGEGIADKRWTFARKKELKESRLVPTRTLVEAIGLASKKPRALLNASAIGYYGPRDDDLIDEETRAGAGFLSALCLQWETEAKRAETYGVRVVLLRTGILLSKNGGALAKMAPPFKFFLGGPLGEGTQFMSWIHMDDEVRGIAAAVEDPSIRGPVNLTAPSCVTMNEFAATLGNVLKKPSIFRVPAFALRVLLGEMAEILLTGQKVYPQKLKRADFRFRFETLEEALIDIFRS